jgi:hypothetical protein
MSKSSIYTVKFKSLNGEVSTSDVRGLKEAREFGLTKFRLGQFINLTNVNSIKLPL